MSYLIEKMDSIWQTQLEERLKYARNLNFSTIPGGEEDFNCPKKKVSRDPMSHRIIEKRRRDRMNNCLADLSRLIPSNYLKKGRGRIEKTEIIEMAIKHLKQLQAHQCKASNAIMDVDRRPDMGTSMEVDVTHNLEQYRLGYQECVSETMHFLVEIEGFYPGDSLCLKLMNHLQKHCDKIVKVERSTAFESKTANETEQKEEIDFVSQPSSHCHSEEEFPAKVLEKALRNGSAAAKKLFQTDETTDGIESKERCGSQLREMLQNPSLTIERGRSMSTGSSRPVSTASSSSGSLRGDEGAYKFKRNIKERFKADQQVCVVGTESDGDGSDIDVDCNATAVSRNERSQTRIDSETKFSSVLNLRNRLDEYSPPSKSLETSNNQEAKCRSRSGVASSNSASPLQDIVKSHHHHRSSSGFHPYVQADGIGRASENLVERRRENDIPIFALHPKGSFYVPMTVDPSIIMPYMSAISNAAPNILHHVGIAVYFYNGTAKIPSAQRIVLETSAAQLATAQQCSQESCLREWGLLARHE